VPTNNKLNFKGKHLLKLILYAALNIYNDSLIIIDVDLI
jgi:hypothetical protein